MHWHPTLLVLALAIASSSNSLARRLRPSSEEDTSAVCPSKNRALYLLALAPFPDPDYPELNPGWEGGPAVIPAAELAVRHVNSRCDLLEDYKLELLVNDSGCNLVPKAVVSIAEGLLDQTINQDKQVVGIVGPGCTAAASAVGDILARKETSLIHITPSATSPVLWNTTRFPNTFRPIATSRSYVDVYVRLIEQQGYRNVTIFYEAERQVHTSAANLLEDMYQAEENISVESFGISNYFLPLSIIEGELRVVFVFSGAALSRHLMCLAFRNNMIYPKYQFFFSERKVNDFLRDVSFKYQENTVNCNEAEMRKAVNGSILNHFRLAQSDQDAVLVSDVTYAELSEEYNATRHMYIDDLRLDPGRVVQTEHNNTYYDSVWALAMALNASIPRLQRELNASLSNYKFGQPEMTDIIRSELVQVNFDGAHGRCSFNSTTQGGENMTIIDIFQVDSNATTRLVGSYNPQDLDNFSTEDVFLEDTFMYRVVETPIWVEAIVFVCVIAVLAVTVFFHVVNLKWNRVSSIKATTPALNNFIFLGCYLYMLSIMFKSFQGILQNNHPVFFRFNCIGFMWCESIALTLIYGTICVKTWRLLRIFSHTSAKMMNNLQTYRLALGILALVCVDVVYNVIWNAVDTWYMETITSSSTLAYTFVCHCNYLGVWAGILAAWKVILVLVVVYLSIATRQIPKKEYKHTRATNSLVYVFIIIHAATLPTNIIFADRTEKGLVILSYLSICLKNILCVVMCNVFIFLPPVLPHLKSKWKECRCPIHPNAPRPRTRRYSSILA